MFLYKHAFILLSLLSAEILWGQHSPGILFRDIDFSTALIRAEQEDKIIFIVFCHTLSTPCQNLKEVLEDSLAGVYFNERFINIALDAESFDGGEVSEKFNVYSYPTYLFVSYEGLLIYRSQGVYDPVRLIALGNEASDPNNQVRNLRNSYEQGDRSEEVLYNYANALFLNDDTLSRKIAGEYLDSFPAWTTRKRMEMVLRIVEEYDDRFYRFLVDKRYLFIKEFGDRIVDGRLNQLIESHFNEMEDGADLAEVKQVYQDVFPSRKSGPFFDYYEMNYLERTGKTGQYIEKAKSYVKKYPSLSWNSLNELAWAFYEKIDDQSALKRAVKWARKSIGLNDNHYNNDTLAALYYKLGNQKRATKYAEKAINLAKTAGEDPSETESLLNKIKSM